MCDSKGQNVEIDDEFIPFPSDVFPEDVFPSDVFPGDTFPRDDDMHDEC